MYSAVRKSDLSAALEALNREVSLEWVESEREVSKCRPAPRTWLGGGGGKRVADHVSVLIGGTQETELLSSTSKLK